MSGLSVNAASEGVVTPPRKAVESSETKTDPNAGAKASGGKSRAPDLSNYVTSPKGVVDPESGVYVLQYRDGATGEVLSQYPSEKVVAAYKRGASNGEAPVASTEPAAATMQTAVGKTGGSTESVSPAAPAPSTSSEGVTSTSGQTSIPLTSTPLTSVDV